MKAIYPQGHRSGLQKQSFVQMYKHTSLASFQAFGFFFHCVFTALWRENGTEKYRELIDVPYPRPEHDEIDSRSHLYLRRNKQHIMTNL